MTSLFNLTSLSSSYFYQKNQQRMEFSYEKLASGKRINTSADDAAGLSIATRMSTRLKSNASALRNIEDDISLLQTANGSLTTVTSILQRIRELSLQAQNGTYSADDKQALQSEANALMDSLDSITSTTTFNSIPLLSTAGLSFDGTSGAIKNKTLKLTGTDSESIFFDIHLNPTSTNNFFLFESNKWSRRIAVDKNGYFSATFYDSNHVIHSMTSKKKFPIPGDYNVGYTFQSNPSTNSYIATLYVNGESIGSLNLGNPLEPGVGPWSFGETYAGTSDSLYRTNGTYQSIRVYKDDLTADEVKNLANGNVTREDLALEYLFNEGKDNTVTDTSDNQNDGTITGKTKWINELSLHTGASASDTFSIGLSKVDTKTLGIHGLDISNEQALHQLDTALETVTSQTSKFAQFQTSLEAKKETLYSSETPLKQTISQIEDADVAEEMSTLTKEKMILQSSLSILAHSREMTESFSRLFTEL